MSVLFAILAIVAGVATPFLVGIGGIIVAVIFGGLAIFFASRKRKIEGGGGMGSIVLAAVGIIISVLMFLAWTGICSKIKDEADKVDATMVKKAFEDNSTWGLLGALGSVDKDDLEQFKEEMERITDNMTDEESSGSSSSSSSESSSGSES